MAPFRTLLLLALALALVAAASAAAPLHRARPLRAPISPRWRARPFRAPGSILGSSDVANGADLSKKVSALESKLASADAEKTSVDAAKAAEAARIAVEEAEKAKQEAIKAAKAFKEAEAEAKAAAAKVDEVIRDIQREGGFSESDEAANLEAGVPDTVDVSHSVTQEVLSGLTVALATIPSSVAYASIANLPPLVGVWSSVVVGFVAPLLGVRAGVVSGAASVVAVPLGQLVAAHGTGIVVPVIAMAAIVEGAFGFLKLGKLVDLVSPAVMAGFLNGLGLLLIKSQLKVFTKATAPVPALAIAAFSAAVVKLFPRVSKKVPAPLVAAATATILGKALALPLKTLAMAAGGNAFSGGLAVLPKLAAMPTLSLSVLKIITFPAISIAIIAALETLLAARVVDEAEMKALGPDEATVTDPDRACIANAGGNLASAALGGFGGCGLIPQTVLNLQSGGRGVLSSVACAVSMAAFVVALAPIVGQVTLPALAGIMLTVGVSTVQWAGSKDLFLLAFKNKAAIPGALGLGVATGLCFGVDMAAGIILGIAVERAARALLNVKKPAVPVSLAGH